MRADIIGIDIGGCGNIGCLESKADGVYLAKLCKTKVFGALLSMLSENYPKEAIPQK